ncbi:Diaminopimelate epimerase [Parafrankia sp. EAN1pec]|nr:Diaminopimelate epimerase [Frankia sp. EAN1pec]
MSSPRPYDRGVRFVKGHGTGNDFLILPDADGELDLSPELVRALCHRGTGIGADGVLRVVLTAAEPAAGDSAAARWFMDYRNADGSIAEMCGNGIRVFARYLVDAGYAAPGRLVIATRAGLRAVEVPAGGDVTVEMGPPELAAGPVPVTVAGREFAAVPVSMGNPHAVCFADDLDPAGLARLDLRAPAYPAAAFPEGVNVEVVVPAPDGVAMRVFERGVGETASCGTGACAVAVAWAARNGDGPPAEVEVDLPGGRLTVGWRESTVLLSGPAVLVSDGVLRPDWLRAAGGFGPAAPAGERRPSAVGAG